MPTGHTIPIEEGDDSFKNFAWRCAKVFGFMLHMRADPENAKPRPPVFDDSYHANALAKALVTMQDLVAMSDEDWHREHEQWWDKQQEFFLSETKRFEDLTEKYDAMLCKVQAYEPPEGLEDLKEYMLNQIKVSRPSRPNCPDFMPLEDFKDRRINWLQKDISYHSQWLKEQEKRQEENMDMYNAFVESLKGVE